MLIIESKQFPEFIFIALMSQAKAYQTETSKIEFRIGNKILLIKDQIFCYDNNEYKVHFFDVYSLVTNLFENNQRALQKAIINYFDCVNENNMVVLTSKFYKDTMDYAISIINFNPNKYYTT